MKIKRIMTRFSALLLAVLTLCFVLPLAALDTAAKKYTDADIAALKNQIVDNQKKIADYEKQIGAIGNDLEDAIAAKEALDQQINTILGTIDDTTQLIEKYDAYIADKTAQIAELEQENEEKYRAFLQRMRISYEDGTRNYLELLVSSDNLIDFMTRSENLSLVLSEEQEMMAQLDAEITTLNSLKESLSEKKREYEELSVLQGQSEEQLQAKLKESEKLIANLEKNEKAAEKAYNSYLAKDKDLDAELKKTIKAYEEQKRKEAEGYLMWPVDLNYLNITSKYGNRKLNGKPDFHMGIDIGVPYGKNIYAANSGTVRKATYSASYGYYILIDHGGNLSTLYAHCSKLLVKAGDTVKKGQVIGYIGATGNAYGYHLHFEVRVNGEHTDPLKGGRFRITRDGKDVDPVASNLIKYY